MTTISLTGAGKDFGLRMLFDHLDLHIGERDRLGLIGPNGAGKSTLLQVLAGREPLDRGRRRCSDRLRVVLLDQQPSLDPDHTVLQAVLVGGGERTALLCRHQELSQALAARPDDQGLVAALSELHHRIDACGAWGMEQQCREVIARLGMADPQRRVGDLSGGGQRRVALAAALVAEPDVLLLDEPTNHLDTEGVEWLQNWLDRFAGALVLVTHDRYLLDRVTRRIVAVEQGEARFYEGNYATYLARRSEEEGAAAAAEASFRNTLRRELDWLRRGPKARSTKQKARLQRIAAMQEAPVRQVRGSVRMATTSQRIGKRVISVDRLRLTVGGGGDEGRHDPPRTLLDDFSYDFSPEDRVGIIGPNGVGKSTLLEALAGRRTPNGGRIEHGATVRLAYFDQHSEVLLGAGADRKVLDVVQEAASRVSVDGVELSASQLLERFLFPPAQQHQPVARLSGGERRRLHLCRLLIEAPNVLLLDEPTNDLDIATLSVLEDFLEDFRGCVVVVSHDRWFLDRCVDRVLSFEAGKLRRFDGNYSAFLEWRLTHPGQEDRVERSRPVPSGQGPPHPAGAIAAATAAPQDRQQQTDPSRRAPSAAAARKRTFGESRELQSIEEQLPLWESRRQEVERSLQALDGRDYSQLEQLTLELAELVEQIEAAEDRWLVLSELVA